MKTLEKISAWLARWFGWLAIAVGVAMGLRRLNQAERDLAKAEDKIRQQRVDTIDENFDTAEDHTAEFLEAQRRAERLAGALNEPLDKMAGQSPAASDVITNWNARNRMHDAEHNS